MTAVTARIFVCLTGFGLLGAYAVHGPSGARQIEAKIQAIAAEELARGRFGWADGRADGRTVVLSGAAPSQEELDAAVTALRSTAAGAIDYIDSSDAIVATATRAAPSGPAAERNGIDPAPASPEPTALADNDKKQNRTDPGEQHADAQAACQTAVSKAMNGRRLTFQHNSAWLGERSRALLDDFAREISACADQTIIIEGHTDTSGTSTINLDVSERRAKAVKNYLYKLGTAVKFEIKAYGETRPIASNRSEAGRSANRRIDFVVAPATLESDWSKP